MRTQSRSAQHEVARIAGRQHGVVTRAQLLATGLSRDAVTRRVRSGVLHRVHPGVYRLGHRAPSVEARYLAAVLACGDGAVLSGLAAAHLFGLLRRTAPAPEVTTVKERHVRGVVTRRVRQLDPLDRCRFRNVPVTTPARAVVDLAGVLGLEDLARACHEAAVRHHVTSPQVEASLARRPNGPGAANLRAS